MCVPVVPGWACGGDCSGKTVDKIHSGVLEYGITGLPATIPPLLEVVPSVNLTQRIRPTDHQKMVSEVNKFTFNAIKAKHLHKVVFDYLFTNNSFCYSINDY